MSAIPNAFGGFAPFPNTIMIPTMGLQSAVIGYRFGFGYEQGKRTLRAMSNEQFNDLDEEAEQAIFKRHDTAAINYFKTEMNNWVALQNLIIEKSVEIEVMKANRTPSAFREMFEGFTSGFGKQQKDDVANFFSTLADPISKLMAWFAGHRADPEKVKKSILKINPITGKPWEEPKPKSTPKQPQQPTIEITPTPRPKVNKCAGLWGLWNIRKEQIIVLTLEIKQLRVRQLQTTGRQNNLISSDRGRKIAELTKFNHRKICRN